jgi:hypothetical protein
MPMSRSVTRKTGVWNRSARSNDWAAKWKHSWGSAGKRAMCFVSPCDAWTTDRRSACWVRVGIPVDGPVRCTSMNTDGTSA